MAYSWHHERPMKELLARKASVDAIVHALLGQVTLNLRANGIGDEGAKAIAQALERNTSLQQLNLGYNEIGAEGVKAIAQALERNTSLQHLDLRRNDIGAEGVKAIAQALARNTSLQHLYLRANKIGDEGAKAIAQALERNTSLQQLNLGSNKIGDEGVKAIAQALERNTSLQHLDLRGNKIGDEGAKAIAQALERNSSLQQLDLSSNGIGAEGAKAIAQALERNTSLQHLYLTSNKIGDEGVKAIAQALQRNSSLLQLDLGCNYLDDEGAKAIAQALERNTSLQQLNLGCNYLDDKGAKAIAQALERNTSLQHLDLRVNGIGAKGAKAIAQALERNTSLQQLDLRSNKIGVAGASAIAQALERNTSLQHLDLSDNDIGAEITTATLLLSIEAMLAKNRASFAQRKAAQPTPAPAVIKHAALAARTIINRAISSHITALNLSSSPTPTLRPPPVAAVTSVPKEERHWVPFAELSGFDAKPLAVGAFGKVYRVTHSRAGSVYAAKVLKVSEAELDEEARNEFHSEAALLLSLRHPHVVQCVGLSRTSEGELVILNEFMQGGGLNIWLYKRPNHSFEPHIKLRLVREIASGIAYMHSMTIVHRDLKSDNILLDEDGMHAKVADLGLAKVRSGGSVYSLKTATGTVMYMAPEMLRKDKYGSPADVYSFALVAFELYVRRRPYTLKQATDLDTIRGAVVERGERPIFKPEDGIPALIMALLQRCWDTEPSKRPRLADIVTELATLSVQP